MEPVQIVLLLVIVILTTLLAVLGIQVFLILREFRKTVEKTNKVLDDAGVIAESIATPVSTLSSLVMSIKTGISFANWLKKTYNLLLEQVSHKGTKEPLEERSEEVMTLEEKAKESNGEAPADAKALEDKKPMVRRFFRGIGRKIKI